MTVRAKAVQDEQGRFYGIRFDCPGCGHPHVVGVDWLPERRERSPAQTGERWGFNGDLARPVLTPSVLCRSYRWDPPVTPANHEQFKREPWPQRKVPYVCHSFVGCNGAAPGQIVFLSDCTQALAGLTVDLPAIE